MSRMKDDCRKVVAALRSERRGPDEEAHLFVCASCREEARFAAAWKSIAAAPREEEGDAAPVPERFVRAVIEGVREDRRRRKRNRLLAAAAALLFFFAVGASHQIASSGSAAVDDTYTQLESQDLGSLLPD
jgi:hypothetical protein